MLAKLRERRDAVGGHEIHLRRRRVSSCEYISIFQSAHYFFFRHVPFSNLVQLLILLFILFSFYYFSNLRHYIPRPLIFFSSFVLLIPSWIYYLHVLFWRRVCLRINMAKPSGYRARERERGKKGKIHERGWAREKRELWSCLFWGMRLICLAQTCTWVFIYLLVYIYQHKWTFKKMFLRRWAWEFHKSLPSLVSR